MSSLLWYYFMLLETSTSMCSQLFVRANKKTLGAKYTGGSPTGCFSFTLYNNFSDVILQPY